MVTALLASIAINVTDLISMTRNGYFAWFISDHDAMQPLSHSPRAVCIMCQLARRECSRTRRRVPLQTSAADVTGCHTDVWRRISDIKKHRESWQTRGTGAGAGGKKKKTSMLHSRWQCLSGSCKHGRRMSRWIV